MRINYDFEFNGDMTTEIVEMNIFADGQSKLHGKMTSCVPHPLGTDYLYNYAFHQN